ncbi:MAG: hypothetical protein K8R90_04145 [Candidatus Cloacimonetes bacterium]|nr:hypothetical protein [Candidatus Cloacimonadota bacterium]
MILNVFQSIGDLILANLVIIIPLFSLVITSSVLFYNIRALYEANRPHVSFFMRHGSSIRDICWVISNTGTRPANNLHINIDPPLVSYVCRNFPQMHNNGNLLKLEISYLAAGQEIENSFDNTLYRYSEKHEDAIDCVGVNLKYSYNGQTFIERYTLDISFFRTLGRTVEANTPEKSAKRIADSVEKIEKLLRDN